MPQFNTSSYSIEKPTGQCAFTDRAFEPGETFIATLVEVDASPPDASAKKPSKEETSPSAAPGLGLKRIDVSREAWEQGKRPDRLFSHWRTKQPDANEKKKLFVDDQVLMSLLRRLADDERPERIAFRFVLALVLMRKKLLRYDGTKRVTVDPEEEGGEPRQEEHWLLTPKLDLSKGPLGKWADDETFEVLDPHLDETRIEQISQQISEILQAEL